MYPRLDVTALQRLPPSCLPMHHASFILPLNALPLPAARKVWLGLTLLVAFCPLPAAVGQTAHPSDAAVPGQFVIRLRTSIRESVASANQTDAQLGMPSSRKLDELRLRYQLTSIESLDRPSPVATDLQARIRSDADHMPPEVYLVSVDPQQNIEEFARELRRDRDVLSVEPNYVGRLAAALPVGGSGVRADPTRHAGVRPIDPLPFNDPFLTSSGSWGQSYPDLWSLYRIGAVNAWNVARGQGVVVAVIDSGIDVGHPDLAPNVWTNPGEIPDNGLDDDRNGLVDDVSGWDFTHCIRSDEVGNCSFGEMKEPGPDVHDFVGHGTHVAGTIAAVGNNGTGVIGVAPNARVMALKAFDRSGHARLSDVVSAILYASQNGATIINASWRFGPSETLRSTIDYAINTFDTVVVAAAGSDGAPLERGVEPANNPHVIAVGAVTQHSSRSLSSNYGGPLDVVAPGGGDIVDDGVVEPDRSILSLLAQNSDIGKVCREEPACDDPQRDECLRQIEICDLAPWVVSEQYVRLSGTSMAAAYTSGVAALVRSRHTTLSAAQVRQALIQYADDLGAAGWDKDSGYGQVNAARAVGPGTLPIAHIVSPENGSKMWPRGSYEIRGDAASPSAMLTGWRLTISSASGGEIATVASGTQPVVGGLLGSLALDVDTTLVPGQAYALRLEVEDADGAVGVDTKAFLIPDPQYAAVPIPNPRGEGLGSLSLSDDGRYAAFEHGHAVSLYDARSHAVHDLGPGFNVSLAPSGRVLTFQDSRCTGMPCDVIYDTTTMTRAAALPFGTWSGHVSFDENGDTCAMVSGYPLDPEAWNHNVPQLYTYDVSAGLFAQVSRLESASDGFGSDLVLSRSGRFAAISSSAQLDPEASTGGLSQVFAVDIQTGKFEQLTGRAPGGTGCVQPTISHDGGRIACWGDDVLVVDRASHTVERVIKSVGDGTPRFPILSADGNLLAFVSSRDLDPRVGNEDELPELFILDLETNDVMQVTDSKNTLGPGRIAMDASGDELVVDGIGEFSDLGIVSGPLRFVRRRSVGNRPPVFEMSRQFNAIVGLPSEITFRASDADGDAVTLYAELLPSRPARLWQVANSEFVDSGEGAATLYVAPREVDIGSYTVRVAAFDERGGVAIQDCALSIESCPGDCDGNGSVVVSELISGINALLGGSDGCASADANHDGRVVVGELVKAVRAALEGCLPG